MSTITILPIEKRHNTFIEKVIKMVFEEHKINKPGTAYFDQSLSCMYESYTGKNMCYYIAEQHHQVVGGAGIYPTQGLPNGTCELIKMYVLPEARGIGLGKTLLEKCLATAADFGFKQVYLETLPELSKALQLYRQFGFKFLDHPLGNSGHFGCSLQMIKEL